jgi:hypothetical protein
MTKPDMKDLKNASSLTRISIGVGVTILTALKDKNAPPSLQADITMKALDYYRCWVIADTLGFIMEKSHPKDAASSVAFACMTAGEQADEHRKELLNLLKLLNPNNAAEIKAAAEAGAPRE